jgi:hypothetical protein
MTHALFANNEVECLRGKKSQMGIYVLLHLRFMPNILARNFFLSFFPFAISANAQDTRGSDKKADKRIRDIFGGKKSTTASFTHSRGSEL